MYPVSIALKAKKSLDGTETEKRLAVVLFDESVQVLSTFELNQIASLTYSNETCDQIFEMLGIVMSNPIDHSVLALQKALVLTTHTLTYGSEKCINSAWSLGRWVTALCDFNTVLMAQKQMGVTSWWNTVKGGAVDRGFPVRDAAQKLQGLLADEAKIRQLRTDKSDPNSLVPIGDDRVAYVSDEVRLFMLKKRMKEQEMTIPKSNLTKAQGGFGSGYQTSNGQTVVGAAHSLEEMMARAEREKKKYTDDGPIYVTPKVNTFQQATPTIAWIPPHTKDLLDMGTSSAVRPPAPAMDLLDFGVSAASTSAPAAMHVLGCFPAATLTPPYDPFGSISTCATVEPNGGGMGDLLSMMSISSASSATPVQHSIFDVTTHSTGPTIAGFTSTKVEQPTPFDFQSVFDLTTQPTSSSTHVQHMTMMSPIQTMTNLPRTDLPTTTSVSNGADRFAALDTLGRPDTKPTTPMLTGLMAENRILGFGSSPSTTNVPPTSTFGTILGSVSTGLSSTFGSLITGPQGLSVPTVGNDVTTMMELGPISGTSSISGSLPTLAPHSIYVPFAGNNHVLGGTLVPPYGMGMMGGVQLSGETTMTPQSNYGLSSPIGMSPLMTTEAPPVPSGGIPGITNYYGPPPSDEDDDSGGFGFAMGGTSGSGLGDPVGLPPAIPPPLPPGL